MNSHFDFRTAYIDLLLNVLTGILFIFILTTALIHPQSKNTDGIKKNAEYLITVVWDKNIDCDVDTWVRDPNGLVVSFKTKDIGLMHLERDDTGFANDAPPAVSNFHSAETNINFENAETVVLRGYVPGSYTVNVHGYNCIFEGKAVLVGTPINLSVDVSLIKINPTFVTAVQRTIVIPKKWDEVTAFNFTLDQQGKVTETNNDEVKLIKMEDVPH